ncbi:MAG: hypothetical protein NC098_03585 [Lachnoclostridium sp.]|nr:hypothetical protein [Lachnoclostridium sp.]
MKKLAVSRKFRIKVLDKINSSFTGEMAERLVSLADSMMTEGTMPDLSAEDQMVKSIFTYISAEIQQAVARSRKARERVRDAQDRLILTQRPCFSIRNIHTGEDVLITSSTKSDGHIVYRITEIGPDFDPDDYKIIADNGKFLSRQLRRKSQRAIDKMYHIDSKGYIVKNNVKNT